MTRNSIFRYAVWVIILLCKKIQSEILKSVLHRIYCCTADSYGCRSRQYSGRCRWKEGGFKSLDRVAMTKIAYDSFTYTRNTKSLVWDDKMYFLSNTGLELRKNPNLTQKYRLVKHTCLTIKMRYYLISNFKYISNLVYFYRIDINRIKFLIRRNCYLSAFFLLFNFIF